jgi:transposase
VRYRAKPVGLRSGLKAQVHAVMAKEGVLPAQGRMFGPAGNARLEAMSLSDSYTTRVKSLRDLIELYDQEVAMLEQQIQPQLWGHWGYLAIQAINGIGPTIAAILAAEIGDVGRFRSAQALCSWAGLAPPTPGVGHKDRARFDHQAGLQTGAVGGDRGGVPLPRRPPPGS